MLQIKGVCEVVQTERLYRCVGLLTFASTNLLDGSSDRCSGRLKGSDNVGGWRHEKTENVANEFVLGLQGCECIKLCSVEYSTVNVRRLQL